MPRKDITKEEYNEYMRVYMLKRYHKQRLSMIEALGGECVECGSTEDLELDHINPSTKSFGLNHAWSKKPEAIKTELAKCQVLCKECHAKKSVYDRGQSPATHGSLTMYQYHKCRCEACRQANRISSKKYKK
jgi:5-methylcytosine-specific restriction endonuclease McrA